MSLTRFIKPKTRRQEGGFQQPIEQIFGLARTLVAAGIEHDLENACPAVDAGVSTGFPLRQTRSVCAQIMPKQ